MMLRENVHSSFAFEFIQASVLLYAQVVIILNCVLNLSTVAETFIIKNHQSS